MMAASAFVTVGPARRHPLPRSVRPSCGHVCRHVCMPLDTLDPQCVGRMKSIEAQHLLRAGWVDDETWAVVAADCGARAGAEFA